MPGPGAIWSRQTLFWSFTFVTYLVESLRVLYETGRDKATDKVQGEVQNAPHFLEHGQNSDGAQSAEAAILPSDGMESKTLLGLAGRWSLALALGAALPIVCGCHTLGFYGQAIKGQCQLLFAQESVAELLKGSGTAPKLRQRLELVGRMRDFAERSLQLPVNGHYRNYAELGRDYVVWNVQAAPEFSLESKQWWYPVVGSLTYRGYFKERAAQRYAEHLKRKQLDVYLSGVSAYSTLGWFKDPLLNTFLFDEEPVLAETLFHELAHQKVFARGDTDFDEAFATVVGEEGARRWLQATASPEALAGYRASLVRTRQFVALVASARSKLAQVYGDERDESGNFKATGQKRDAPRDGLRREKDRIIAELRRSYSRLKEEWGGNGGYDVWFAEEINNAKLNSVAAYYDLVPAFERLLIHHERDLARFYGAVEDLAGRPRAERHESLRKLME